MPTTRRSTVPVESSYRAIHEAQKLGHHEWAVRKMLYPTQFRLQKPYRTDPNHAWYLVGHSFFNLRDFVNAIRAFRKSVDYDSTDAYAWWAIADAQLELRRYRRAEMSFRAAINLCRGSRTELLYNLANVLYDQGKWDEAAATYRKLIRRKSKLQPAIRRNLALTESHLLSNGSMAVGKQR